MSRETKTIDGKSTLQPVEKGPYNMQQQQQQPLNFGKSMI